MKKVISLLLLLKVFNAALLYPQNNESSDGKILKVTDSIELLADRYLRLNDYNTANELYKNAYNKKLISLPSDDILIVNSLAKLSLISLSLNNTDSARKYINEALSIISNNTAKYRAIRPFVVFVNAKIHERLNRTEEADRLYEQYFTLVQNEPQILNSPSYIDALTDMSLFYARRFGPANAFKYAHLANDAAKNSFSNSSIHLKALQNIANMYFGFSYYKKGQRYSEDGLTLFYEKLNAKEDIRDQVAVEKLVPYLIWINVKTKYFLRKEKDTVFLKELALQMDEGIEILNRNKSILVNPDDINILFDHFDLFFSFAKQLHLDLYHATGDDQHLDRLIQLHESVLYSKIRKRLNSVDNIVFDNIPIAISKREELLKNNLDKSIRNPLYQNKSFLKAEKEWSIFLDSLKHRFPKYHKLNYASVEQTINDSRALISKDETLVRYLYIEKRLYAIVLSKENKEIVALPYINLKLYNEKIRDHRNNIEILNPILNTLYYHIWEPLKDKVRTKKLVIIPDGELFNLNFELLNFSKLKSFQELATTSLLADHTISYNYSLLLLEKDRKTLEFEKDYVAFAPEFNKSMKDDYQIAITDSVNLDKTYLTLLPQPFISDVAKRFSNKFSGSSFLNEKASKQLFTQTAREHKIIHIGTHAESNNASPELSRLVFAKNVSDSTSINDNYLYTYEIYNQDLSSNLAILTACETGKPTYQPGEGMISLAHAFNYAGSESILTSLWQIDEQSSTQILEYFYTYLEDGLSKDEALKNAKLDYLTKAKGRTLHPQYWAGLVLMGDTEPIALTASRPWLLWFCILGGLVILGAIYYYRIRK